MERSTMVTIIVIALVLVIGVFFVWTNGQDADNDGFADSIPADSFKRLSALGPFYDLSGNEVSLDEYEGKTVVINSWASWCPFCTQELPDFAALAETYNNREVIVLAINRAESEGEIEAYLKSIADLTGVIILRDPSDSFYSFIGGFSMPETVFYNVNGEAMYHKRGFMSAAEMTTHLDAALSNNTENQ